MTTDLIEMFMDRVDEIENRTGKVPSEMYLFETEYLALKRQVERMAELKSAVQMVAYIHKGRMIIADVHVKMYSTHDNLTEETTNAFESLRSTRRK